MILRHHNTLLKSITVNDIELIRNWRNSKRVNRFLITRNAISAEAQLRWFESLDPATSIYFLIQESSKNVGLVYAHNIDMQIPSFEGSIFIGEDDFTNTFVPVKAAIMVTLFFFNDLNFAEAHSTIHIDNLNAQTLDKKLGYQEVSRHNGFIKNKCLKKDFFRHAQGYINALLRNEPMLVSPEQGDDKYSFMLNKFSTAVSSKPN